MLVEYDHPVAGRVRTTGSPIHLDGSPARGRSMPPPLGADTRALLAELGVDEGSIEEMIESGRAVAPMVDR
jgi:crotonobetainyl-CoA:carnitine CoA-transferase CaiB-like acyl-CoA transferase